MSFTAFQHLIAQLTLEAIADLGFALGGGQALHAHGYGDRLSRDLDFYVPRFDQDLFDQAEVAVLAALRARSYTAEVGHSDTWLRQILDLTIKHLDGDKLLIHTTAEHPFWSNTRNNWIYASELAVGEELRTVYGEPATIIAVSAFTAARFMHNLTVADIHTYYVAIGDTPVLVHNDNDIPLPTQVQGRNQPLTNKEAEDLAKYLGYRKTNFRVRGQPVFTNGKTFISQDVGSGDGSHNGGTWKIGKSVNDLGKKSTRLATTDALLNEIGC